MIESRRLLADLVRQRADLEADLRERCEDEPALDEFLQEEHRQAVEGERTALPYAVWRDDRLTQVAVAWILGCVFVRFLEDNGLVDPPRLSGPGDRRGRALDEHTLYFRAHPDRERSRLPAARLPRGGDAAGRPGSSSTRSTIPSGRSSSRAGRSVPPRAMPRAACSTCGGGSTRIPVSSRTTSRIPPGTRASWATCTRIFPSAPASSTRCSRRPSSSRSSSSTARSRPPSRSSASARCA